MKGYSDREVFSVEDVVAWEIARDAVKLIDEHKIAGDDLLRCHELARAVQTLLERCGHEWKVVDGKFGIVDHSWLIRPKQYVILDPYAVGRLPMVQLVSVSPKFDLPYREGRDRDDVRQRVVDRLNMTFERLSETRGWGARS